MTINISRKLYRKAAALIEDQLRLARKDYLYWQQHEYNDDRETVRDEISVWSALLEAMDEEGSNEECGGDGSDLYPAINSLEPDSVDV